MLFFLGHSDFRWLVKDDAELSHLHQLLLEAHMSYRNIAVEHGASYKVFMQQFLDGHMHIDGTATEKNTHSRLLGLIRTLLTEERKAVVEFFDKEKFAEADTTVLLHSVIQKCCGNPKVPARTKQSTSNRLRCMLTEDDMVLLADIVTRAEIFKSPVTPRILYNFLHGKLSRPLVAFNLGGLAYLMEEMSKMNLVQRYWQTALERDGSVLLQNMKKTQSHTNFSSAMSRVRNNGCPNQDVIDSWVRHYRDLHSIP